MTHRRTRPRGFTLVEMMTVVGIAGILAALAISYSRAAARNVELSQAAGELATRVTGLRSTALAAGTDHLLVVVDAPGNDASQCSWMNSSGCARYFVLAAPQAGWSIDTFDPANPTANASILETNYLPRGARFFNAGAPAAPPAPFSNVAVFDSRFSTTCSGVSCFAVRFTQNGLVRAERPGGGIAPGFIPGFGFALASDASLGRAGDHQGVVIGFPSGVVKTWSFAP